MLIAVQSSAPFGRREGVAPHILCADSALQVILAVIKSATPRVEKVCTLNAKGTTGRRRPKRSRQKSSAITLRISRLTIRQSASWAMRKECATTE